MKAKVQAPMVEVTGSGTVDVSGGITKIKGAGLLKASGAMVMIG